MTSWRAIFKFRAMAQPGFPLRVLMENPRVMNLPAAGFGMLARIVIHFWQTECRAIPTGNDEMFSIARAHRPTWIAWRDEIMIIFSEISPELERRRRRYDQQMGELKRLGIKGGSVLSLRAAQRKAVRAAASPVPVVPIVSQANRAPKVVATGRSGFADR